MIPALPQTFTSILDFVRLPWFSLDESGRLVMTDESIGPIADLHTHLALAYIRPPTVDYGKLHPETEHYLPSCCAIDLDVYANKNISPENVKALKKDLTWGSFGPRGMRRTHTIPNLLREMAETGIRAAVLLPIDFPHISDNASIALSAAASTSKILSAGSVHPFTTRVESRLDDQLGRGARGVKVHPSVQLLRPDARRAQKLYRMAGERDMFVFWHCGPTGIEPKLGQYLNQLRFYEAPIRDNPKTTFLLGHSGALQFEEALRLQKAYPNVWLETSSQSVSNVRRMVLEADPNRIVHGSDWPFYHPAISVAKILIATQDRREIRHKMLWGNAARLLHID